MILSFVIGDSSDKKHYNFRYFGYPKLKTKWIKKCFLCISLDIYHTIFDNLACKVFKRKIQYGKKLIKKNKFSSYHSIYKIKKRAFIWLYRFNRFDISVQIISFASDKTRMFTFSVVYMNKKKFIHLLIDWYSYFLMYSIFIT